MKRPQRFLAAAALLSALSGLAAETPIFAPNDRVSIVTEPTLVAGLARLDVRSSVKGASLYMDKAFMGKLPYTGNAAPGSHLLEAAAPGYRDLGVWLFLEEKTSYSIRFKPELITGFLWVEVEPEDAYVRANGMTVIHGSVELPIGKYTLVVSRFGYIERVIAVEIEERRTTKLTVSLEKAPFAVTGLAFSRPAFNPRNAGAPGKTSLDFRASSYGSASAVIRGPGGELVSTLYFPDIRTWNQSKAWDGLGPDGKALPDGLYAATLTALPAPGVEPEAPVVARAEARIDSSLVIRSIGTASALPGLLYMPAPIPQPSGTTATEISWFAPWGEPQASAFGLSGALSLGDRAAVGLGAAAETGDSANAADLAISGLVALFGDRTSALGGALFLRASYSSASKASMPGSRSGLEASFPLSLRLGESSAGELSLALSPGALADLSSSSPGFLALARGGLWLEGRSFRAGVSGELPVSFSAAAPAPLWPARAALEGRLMLGSTPFVAAAYLGAALEPAASPRLELGIGLGLLF